MKFRTEIRRRLVEHTVDGITHTVNKPYTKRVPVLPADWDARAIKAASTLVLALTAIAVVWSTVSIGALLHGGPGYAAAAVFDVAWVTVLLLEWMARFDPDKREFARNMGFVLVGVTAGAIFWHGLLVGSVAMAVVGAAVSVIAKALWMAIFKHVDKPLSDADRQWVDAEISKANAKLAVAGVRRRVAVAEVQARAEILAAEQILNQLDDEANTAEQIEIGSTEPNSTSPLASPNKVREQIEPVPSITELARQQVAAGASNKDAAAEILRLLPTANAESVQATVRREARRVNGYL
ncbi:hypothetical protein [Streptomyces sp. NPDC058255]|uniref:hypothetical protein n=1 Tax=Streptomyces sp. NPDC058255 TaxID=3346407 RepID=UPI0036E03CDC